jgi:AcrR family transcriptional regulator
MTSLRHNSGPDDVLLDAARARILAVGWKRTTLTDVARNAGVSRMTIYRRWSDMDTLLADLMTREWSVVVEDSALEPDASALQRLAGGVSATVAALRDNDLFRKIVTTDPELLIPYLLDRRGRTQDSILAMLEAAIVAGQEEGSVRKANPTRLARSILLTAHGFALSAQTMTQSVTQSIEDTEPSGADLDAELRSMIERYLVP